MIALLYFITVHFKREKEDESLCIVQIQDCKGIAEVEKN